MKKNKLYTLLSIVILICLFGTSALCNQCAADPVEEVESTEEEAEASEEEAAEEEETVEEEPAEEESAEEEAVEEEEEETQTATEEPTIELQVYEGPIYSQADDVCYWRVKAVVTGVPAPTVEFSRDDSSGAWGSKKAQVNLENPTDTYSLQATATNSEGSAVDSIELTWECNRPPEISDIIMMGDHFVGIEYEISVTASDPDQDTLTYSWSINGGTLDNTTGNPINWTMPGTAGSYQVTVEVDDGNGGKDQRTESVDVTDPILSMDVPIAPGEGGWALNIGNSGQSDWSYTVGDSAADNTSKGFISFDISGLAGATIESANLAFKLASAIGDPSSFTPLWVASTYWGAEPIEDGDYNLPSDPIDNYSSPDFVCTNSKLKLYLQNAITDGKTRFQLVIFFTGMATDNDLQRDIWNYTSNTVDLDVTYRP